MGTARGDRCIGNILPHVSLVLSFIRIFSFLLQKTVCGVHFIQTTLFQERPVLKYLTHMDARQVSSKRKGFMSLGGPMHTKAKKNLVWQRPGVGEESFHAEKWRRAKLLYESMRMNSGPWCSFQGPGMRKSSREWYKITPCTGIFLTVKVTEIHRRILSREAMCLD